MVKVLNGHQDIFPSLPTHPHGVFALVEHSGVQRGATLLVSEVYEGTPTDQTDEHAARPGYLSGQRQWRVCVVRWCCEESQGVYPAFQCRGLIMFKWLVQGAASDVTRDSCLCIIMMSWSNMKLPQMLALLLHK